MAVFSIVVAYRSGDKLRRFNTLTNANWDEFREMVCVCTTIGRDSPWAYRQFHSIAAHNQFANLSGYYGSARPLTGAKDWEMAIVDLREAGRKFLDVEIEIWEVSEQKVGADKSSWAEKLCSLTVMIFSPEC